MPGPSPTCASQKSTPVRESCGYIWQSVPMLVSVPSRRPVHSASRSRSSRIGGWILAIAPFSLASASGAVQ